MDWPHFLGWGVVERAGLGVIFVLWKAHFGSASLGDGPYVPPWHVDSRSLTSWTALPCSLLLSRGSREQGAAVGRVGLEAGGLVGILSLLVSPRGSQGPTSTRVTCVDKRGPGVLVNWDVLYSEVILERQSSVGRGGTGGNEDTDSLPTLPARPLCARLACVTLRAPSVQPVPAAGLQGGWGRGPGAQNSLRSWPRGFAVCPGSVPARGRGSHVCTHAIRAWVSARDCCSLQLTSRQKQAGMPGTIATPPRTPGAAACPGHVLTV